MSEMTLQRHPIRGFIWGLMTGAGVGLLLMVLSVVPLSIPTLATYTGVSAVLGVLWGSFAPPKKPKGAPAAPPPAEAYQPPPAEAYEPTPTAAHEPPPAYEPPPETEAEPAED